MMKIMIMMKVIIMTSSCPKYNRHDRVAIIRIINVTTLFEDMNVLRVLGNCSGTLYIW